jgi:hypothetical protein
VIERLKGRSDSLDNGYNEMKPLSAAEMTHRLKQQVNK